MIATGRGVVIAAAIAAVLWIAVVLDLAVDLVPRPGAIDRSLVPGFDPDRVTALVWERAGQPAIDVVRDGDTWRERAGTRVDPGAISDVLAALRGARWHRRGDATAVHATLTVVGSTTRGRRTLGIGAPIAGTDQTWIVAGDRGLLVDGWVARALDRDRFALRIKAPLADIARAQTIAIASEATHAELRIDGHPRRLIAPAVAATFVLASDVASQLEHVLGQIAIVRLPDTPVTAHGIAITVDGGSGPTARSVHVAIGGSCPGAPALVALSGTDGDGCIESATAAEVERAIGRLNQPASANVERRPIPFETTRVQLADGVALDTAPLRVGDAPADTARVAELLAALAAPAEPVAAPATPPVQHLVVGDRSGAAITLDLFAAHVLARHGESIALRPAPGAWSLLVRPSRELRDPTLWLEEATTITAIAIDRVRYQRGQVIGAWTREPAGSTPLDPPAVEALASALAAPRAVGFLDGGVAVVHRVTLTIAPPVGAPRERVLELGAPGAAGCPALVGRDAVVLAARVCAQVAALAR
jgi:hypothetical protein